MHNAELSRTPHGRNNEIEITSLFNRKSKDKSILDPAVTKLYGDIRFINFSQKNCIGLLIID